MQCPVCKMDQVIAEVEGVELDLCIDGCGTWFDAQELRQLFATSGTPALLHDLEQRLEGLPSASGGPSRECPRCSAHMERVRAPAPADAVILDRCARGHGLWFDPGELDRVLSLSLGEDDRALGRVKEFLARFEEVGDQTANTFDRRE